MPTPRARVIIARAARGIADIPRRVGESVRQRYGTPGPVVPAPSKFGPGEFTPEAELAKVGLSLISHARAQANYEDSRRMARLRERHVEAQIGALERRNVEPTYQMEIDQPRPEGFIGPMGPPTTVQLSGPEFARESRMREPKPVPARTPYQTDVIDIARQRVAIAREKLAKSTSSTNEWRAAQAELLNLERQEKAFEAEALSGARQAAQAIQSVALHGDPRSQAEALRALGLIEGAEPWEVEAAAKHYAERDAANRMNALRTKNEPRRRAAQAVTQGAAGLEGLAEVDAIIQQLEAAFPSIPTDEE